MKSFIIEMVLFLIKYVCVCAFFGSFSDEIHFGKKKERTCHQFKDQFRGNRKMRLM